MCLNNTFSSLTFCIQRKVLDEFLAASHSLPLVQPIAWISEGFEELAQACPVTVMCSVNSSTYVFMFKQTITTCCQKSCNPHSHVNHKR